MIALPGREELRSALQDALDEGGAARDDVVLVKLDLDQFRDVNAAFGRDAGDVVLGLVAGRLAELAQHGWLLAHLTGGRFAALRRTSCGSSGPATPVAQVLERLSGPFSVRGVSITVRATAGVAVRGASARTVSADRVLHDAEVALYRAKREHVGFALYDPVQDSPAEHRLERISELQEAVDRGQFLVHYQPVVHLTDLTVRSVEALVRWQHPVRGLVPPLDFIPLAEECGVVSAITRAVVEQVLCDSLVWRAAGHVLRCAVNVSVHCLTQDGAAPETVALFVQHRELMSLEVTESILAVGTAVSVLQHLQEQGVSLALDDFGTGYSTYGSLSGLPIDVLKIDRSLVVDVATDPRDAIVVDALVTAAHALGLTVVAEGMEEESTARVLRDLGVDHGQGYYFSRPLPLTDLLAWLDKTDRGGVPALERTPPGGAVPTPRASGEASREIAVDENAVALEASRSLLRTNNAEQCVGVLLRAVGDLGASTVPVFVADDDAVPIDISLGRSDVLLPVAPLRSAVRRRLLRVLPGIVEDAKVAVDRADRLQDLSRQVDTDPLTGLGNRRRLADLRGLDRTCSAAVLDLDHFKAVNDSLGHGEGDRVLVAFARALRQHLRSTDLVFRLGGEEFLVLFPSTEPEAVLTALALLRARWEVERPAPITFSAGVAAVDDGNLPDAVLRADSGLYTAKNKGRDRFELASDGLAVPLRDQLVPP